MLVRNMKDLTLSQKHSYTQLADFSKLSSHERAGERGIKSDVMSVKHMRQIGY
jgi:hypothetical protein